MVARNTNVEAKRIDDNTIEIITTISEKYSNKEFYQYWTEIRMLMEQIRTKIDANLKANDQLEKNFDINKKHVDNLHHLAEDCKARY